MAAHKSIPRLLVAFIVPLLIAALATALPHLVGSSSADSVLPVVGMLVGLIFGAVLVTTYTFSNWLIGGIVISAYFLFVGLGVWLVGFVTACQFGNCI